VLNSVDVEFIGLRLQFAFPQSHARAVAAAPVGLSLRAILSAVVAKIANEFLFLVSTGMAGRFSARAAITC
jgi:hypothetical protein